MSIIVFLCKIGDSNGRVYDVLYMKEWDQTIIARGDAGLQVASLQTGGRVNIPFGTAAEGSPHAIIYVS